jgi:hypothetical protein
LAAIDNSLSSVRRIEDEFSRAIETTMRSLERQITPLINQFGSMDVIDSNLTRQQVQDIINRSGYFETVGRLLNDGYQEIIDEVVDYYSRDIGRDLLFSDTDLAQLTDSKNLDLNEFNQISNDLVETITRSIAGLSFTGVDFNNVIDDIQSEIDKASNNMRTWITTGTNAIFSTSLVLLAATNGISKYKYVGPLDAKTRPFCKEHTGEIKTIEEWNQLDNGQINPISVYRGGYNCRHALVGVL